MSSHSDDRSPEVFRTRIEAATQMRSVLGSHERPNCLIIDEIDGAPAVSWGPGPTLTSTPDITLPSASPSTQTSPCHLHHHQPLKHHPAAIPITLLPSPLLHQQEPISATLLSPQASINVLLSIIQRKDREGEAGAGRRRREEGLLLRPIICICNDQ